MRRPPLVARLAGINKYSEYPAHRPEGDISAIKLETFLKDEFTEGNKDDIQIISDTRKVGIIDALELLRSKFDRNNTILFFFSGYGGRTTAGTSIICPADIGRSDKSKGITDQELGQLFDSISRTRGNNIIFLLDSASRGHNWGNPSSFVVVAPRSVDPANRKAFTNSIIDVLRSEKGSIATLTVQSFAAKIHAFMPNGIEIDCYGQNIDRLLFNPTGGGAHYTFIPGRTETNGNLTLFAGVAHGVQQGATYAIYANHVDTKQNRLGYLKVKQVHGAITAELCRPSPNSTLSSCLPPVFYAVETRCPHETVDIFSSVDTPAINSLSLKKAAENEANITLRLINDRVHFIWNGYADARVKTGTGNNLSIPDDKQELTKAIRHAERFTYHVGTYFSLSPPLFEVEFREFDKDTGEPHGKDLLVEGLADLTITKDNPCRTFCLILRNKAPFDIWPFVFICEPSQFSIQPWYIPKQALATAETKSELIIGCGDEDELMFEWQPKSTVDLTYIKIFVTKDHTSFSFLTQYGLAIEDTLREVGQSEGTTVTPDSGDSSENLSHTKRPTSEKGDWDTKRITIRQRHDPEDVKAPSSGARRFAKLVTPRPGRNGLF